MIRTTTSTPIPFTPSFLEGQPKAPSFLLVAGGVMARADIEAELAGPLRAGEVYGYELRQAFRSGLTALLAGDPDLDHLLELEATEAERASEALRSGADAEPLADDDRRLLSQARDVLTEHWPDYQALVTRMERRRKFAPLLAFRRFCVGWENIDVPWRRGLDGLIPEDLLTAENIEPILISAAGGRAFSMLYGGGQEKNSPQPSQSDDGPQTSNSDDTSKADG